MSCVSTYLLMYNSNMFIQVHIVPTFHFSMMYVCHLIFITFPHLNYVPTLAIKTDLYPHTRYVSTNFFHILLTLHSHQLEIIPVPPNNKCTHTPSILLSHNLKMYSQKYIVILKV